jgi:mono/diheme cytochrome c family protein
MRSASVVFTLALGFWTVGSAAAPPVPTFSKEVAPILFKNCVNCHRPGEIASSAPLLSYEMARPWAKAIREKVLAREMPPWPADPNGKEKFRNDRRLNQQDIDTLVAWVNAGAPKGNDADLPPMPKFAQGWLDAKGRAPDLVIPAPEVDLPVRGEVPYVRYLAKVPFSEDKWIVTSQARPGNPAVVHHMAITEIVLDDGLTPANLGPIAQLFRQIGAPNDLVGTRPAVTAPGDPTVYDMLGVYTPGSTVEMYPEGTGKLLKGGKNLYINFNIHYQSTGKPEKDRSMIAFWFLPGPPKFQMFRVSGAGGSIIANGQEVMSNAPGERAEGTSLPIPPIPPFAGNYEVIGITAYTEPVTIYQLQPHAHLRGKDFKYTVVYPNGQEETVLSVPKYDFRWQLAYELETPLKLPAGSKLVVAAHYDNSVNNKYNPGPEKEVYFRGGQNQSWDEMFTPFVQYTMDNQDLTQPPDVVQAPRQTATSQQKELREQSVLDIVGAVGCLEQNSPGTWMLTNASAPVVSKTQSTSSVGLKTAEAEPLGTRRYQLLGASVFNPSIHQGQKMAVKGILIQDTKESRLNVTSLQMVDPSCER